MSAMVDGSSTCLAGRVRWATSYDFTQAYDPAQDKSGPAEDAADSYFGLRVLTARFSRGRCEREPIVHPDAVFYRN